MNSLFATIESSCKGSNWVSIDRRKLGRHSQTSNHDTSNSKTLIPIRNSGTSTSQSSGFGIFTIKHFAGTVEYTLAELAEKNLDKLDSSVEESLLQGSSPVVRRLYEYNQSLSELRERTRIAGMQKRRSADSTGLGMGVQKRRSADSTGLGMGVPAPQLKLTATISSKFRSDLTTLLTELRSAQCQFVRCVKPNARTRAGMFDPFLVNKQLQCIGVMDVSRVRQLGFPIRWTW